MYFITTSFRAATQEEIAVIEEWKGKMVPGYYKPVAGISRDYRMVELESIGQLTETIPIEKFFEAIALEQQLNI